MARRDFSACDTELDIRLAKRTDITSTMRGYFLNDALRAVAVSFKHPELQITGTGTLSSGTDSFTITISGSAELWWPSLVRDNTVERTLKLGEMDQIEDRTKPSSNPYKYYWWGNVFYTDAKPTASHTMKVWGIRQIVEWSSGSAPMNQVYDPLIIMTAAYVGLTTVRDYEEAERQLQQMKRYVAEFKLPVNEATKDDRSTGIQVRFR